MRERATVRLSQHGNSLMVAIPRPLRYGLGLVIGDLLDVELHRAGGFLTIRKIPIPPSPIATDAPIGSPADALDK